MLQLAITVMGLVFALAAAIMAAVLALIRTAFHTAAAAPGAVRSTLSKASPHACRLLGVAREPAVTAGIEPESIGLPSRGACAAIAEIGTAAGLAAGYGLLYLAAIPSYEATGVVPADVNAAFYGWLTAIPVSVVATALLSQLPYRVTTYGGRADIVAVAAGIGLVAAAAGAAGLMLSAPLMSVVFHVDPAAVDPWAAAQRSMAHFIPGAAVWLVLALGRMFALEKELARRGIGREPAAGADEVESKRAD